jgi:hypothetical protein
MTNNQIAVNGISTFNAGSTFKSTPIVSGTDLRVMDTGNNQGIQIFASNDLGNNNTVLQGIGANSRFQINTNNATNQFRNLFVEYGNHSQLSTATCGIDCLNDTVLLFSNSTTPTISIAPTYPDNTTKIATTSFVSSAITNINPAIRYPPTNSNTLNINNTISLTDGTTTNTLNQSDWTGTIKTVNTAADATHFLNFSDSSGTGQGHPQKSSNITCNPSTGLVTATTFVGALTGNATTASNASTISVTTTDTNSIFHPIFTNGPGTTKALNIDSVTGPLTYVPNTGTLTCTQISITDIQLPTTANVISFSGNILTINGGNSSFRNYNWVLSGTTNIMIGLVFTSFRVNADYTIGILNNGTDTLTINKVLGGNNRTRFTSDVIVPAGGYAVMNIQILSINSALTTIVDAYNVA